ncbi:leucine-rich repeat-containing protein 71 [Gastrophryne carolinensis]
MAVYHSLAEDYQCTGNLEHDVSELCARLGFLKIPKVVPRARAPSPPASEKTAYEDGDWVSGRDSAGGHVRERASSFQPSIQVEEDSEDSRSIRELSIRGWKIDDRMMTVLSKCLPTLTGLRKISLWNVGLTDSTFCDLIAILRLCPSVRVFALEGNPLAQQSFFKLISDDLMLSDLSLRNNRIDDDGAVLIGQSLRSLSSTNKTLVSLVLSYNHIGNRGAAQIAQALRCNRSLLSLNLSSNRIGDEGALPLAEVLGRFALTHAELVERRSLLLEKEELELPRSPPTSRRAESKSERPGSHLGSSHAEKSDKSLKSKPGAPKKREKETQRKEEKSPPSHSGGGASSAVPQAGGSTKKEEPKSPKKQPGVPDQKNGRGKAVKSATKRVQPPEQEETQRKEEKSPPSHSGGGASSAVPQAGGSTKKEEPKSPKKQPGVPDQKNGRGKAVKSATKRVQPPEQEQASPAEPTNPLLARAWHHDGIVLLSGNKVLISLNLSRNRITELGLRGFLAAMEMQNEDSRPISGTRSHTGLLRLAIGLIFFFFFPQNNNFQSDCPTLARLQEVMLPRDPIRKSPRSSEEEETLLGHDVRTP